MKEQEPKSGIQDPHDVRRVKDFIKNATTMLDDFGKKQNKLPLSEFHRYVKLFRHNTDPSLALEQNETELTKEFHQRVNLYADIEIVDDHDPNKVIAVLPKLLRSLDALDPHANMKVIAAFNGSVNNNSVHAQHEIIGRYAQEFITSVDSSINVEELKEEIKETSRNIERVCELCGITSPLKEKYRNTDMDLTGKQHIEEDDFIDDSGDNYEMVFDDDDDD